MDWDAFKDFCIGKEHLQFNTYRNRKRYLKHLIKNCDVDNPDSVYKYFSLRISNGTKGYQLNNYIKTLNIFYRFKKHDHYFKLYKSYEKPVKIPTKQDIALLLRNCSRSHIGKRTKTIIYLMCNTGLRNKELCELSFDCIDWVHNEIRLVGKWDRPRVIPVKDYVLHGKYVPSLKNYIDHHRKPTSDKHIFTTYEGQISTKTVRDDVKRVARKSGISWVHPHSFRHFYATTLLSKNINVKVVQKLLGHGNVRETSRYLHAKELDIRRAIKDTDFDSLLKGGFELDFNLTNFTGGI